MLTRYFKEIVTRAIYLTANNLKFLEIGSFRRSSRGEMEERKLDH